MQELVEAGVDRIFLPSILTRSGDDVRFSHSCPYVQAVPYMIKAALSASLLTPEVHLSRGEDVFVAGLAPALAELGVGRHEIARSLPRRVGRLGGIPSPDRRCRPRGARWR